MVELKIVGNDRHYRVQPSKIIALGLNYREHIAESLSVQVRGFDSDVPEEPVLFPKTPNVLIGPEDSIVIPRFLKRYGFDPLRVDHEAELAILIGKRGKDIPEERAFEFVFGYTCMNDVSARNIQNGDRSGWFRGKSFDTFGPIGPVVVPASQIPDPQNLAISCRINGRTVQDSNTRHMIFSIPQIIAFVSANFSLEEGDIILTGTPAGVSPLSHDDTVEVEIEGIGVLRNRVVDETRD